jgi:hypothetical protein
MLNLCTLHDRGVERIVDVVPGGLELEHERRGVGQAAHARNNTHVKCAGVFCA